MDLPTSPDIDLPEPPPSAPTAHLTVLRLGRRPYVEVWEQQRALQRALIDRCGGEHLLVCEHPPTITVGRRGTGMNNLRASREEIEARGIALYEVERGGDVTFHGPGQIVAYPILDLTTRRRDVGWYMRSLEQVIINTLQALGITGFRVPGRTGVWTHSDENDTNSNGLASQSVGKIASIGVRISRWCTMHGVALNVRDCSAGFDLINPCGFTDIHMSSVEECLGGATIGSQQFQEIENSLVRAFTSTF